jgi:hypothetical protein
MSTKSIFQIIAVLFISVYTTNVFAQTSPTIAQSLGLYAFPPQGKDAAAQEADEMACFKWAKEQTGYDPMNPTQVQAAQVDKSADGTAVVGAAKGAAAGAAIGSISGDMGKGAAYGAIIGGISGRRAKKMGDQQKQQQANQAAAAAQQNMAADYNKAFTVCMEAKGYTIK